MKRRDVMSLCKVVLCYNKSEYVHVRVHHNAIQICYSVRVRIYACDIFHHVKNRIRM